MKESNFPEEFDFTEEAELTEEPIIEEALESQVAFESDTLDVETLPAEDVLFDETELTDALPAEDDLYHEDLMDPTTGEELDAADHAMYSAGLQHPEDAQFRFDEDLTNTDENLEIAESKEAQPGVQEIFDETPTSPKERPVRKGRPKRRKGVGLLGSPHLMAAAVWLLMMVAIGTSLGRLLWVCAADVLAFGREDKEVTVSVTSEDNMESIAEKLHDAGLIRYPKLFLLYADLTDVEEEGKITTGTFTLNTVYDYHALIRGMSPRSGNRAVVEDVLIPEGYNCRQIFALLEDKGICKAADLEKWAAGGELSDYWVLEGVERGDK